MSTPRYGKGDTPRPVDKKKFNENYDAIFRKGRARSKTARARPRPK